MSKKAKELAARYGKKSDILEIVQEILDEQQDEKRHYLDTLYRVSAFSNPDYPIVTTQDSIQVMKWGLIPFWVKGEEKANEIRKMTYNAKAESVLDKPSFREPIKSRRCIVPSTGFFEWRHEGKKKIPYYIQVKDQDIFSMAGIFDVWNNNGKSIYTFSIITTQANELMEFIHNTKKRMPAILSNEQETKWLDPGLQINEISEIIKPFDASNMSAYTIENDFLKKQPNDKSIIKKGDPPGLPLTKS